MFNFQLRKFSHVYFLKARNVSGPIGITTKTTNLPLQTSPSPLDSSRELPVVTW